MTQEPIPLLGKASFKCPHCGANSHQDWYELRAKIRDRESSPRVPDADAIRRVTENSEISKEHKPELIEWVTRMRTGKVFFHEREWESYALQVENLWLSQCFSCKAIAAWVHDCLLFPAYNLALTLNNDLPDDTKSDFIEAAKILDLSPRGSAALLRLCIQKLCKHLGKSGDNLNSDIAELVADGLNVRIQRGLDIVRVVGNNAVHPGQMDLADDKDTAVKLFRLVNMVSYAMISQPKHVDSFYDELPESARQQIERRDAGKT
ncbi:MAG TPA: DUF4145 domain-containing protein [Candidatus Dormibacteraeota bacterium]|nr:DUF4145 domain-containing protein [Candidatus Dormibacteraeota bacterium]